MKKIFSLLFIILITTSLYADPYFSGELVLADKINLSRNIDTYNLDNTANAKLRLNMDVKSNGVKFYLEGLIYNLPKAKNLNYTLNKAYIKYRLPYKDSYINFQVGKSYYSMGGGLIYNAGNPIIKDSSLVSALPTVWNAVATLPLYQGENYDTLYIGFLGIIPLEESSSKAGAFLNYEINNKYFDNIEISVLSDLSSTKLCFGYDGTLYFDYGVYGKLDLQNLENFDFTVFLTKVYDKLTFNCESLYQNKKNQTSNKVLYATPTISYAATDKLSLSLSNTTTITFQDELTILNALSGTVKFSIVQGFDIYSTLSSEFKTSNFASLTFGTNYKF